MRIGCGTLEHHLALPFGVERDDKANRRTTPSSAYCVPMAVNVCGIATAPVTDHRHRAPNPPATSHRPVSVTKHLQIPRSGGRCPGSVRIGPEPASLRSSWGRLHWSSVAIPIATSVWRAAHSRGTMPGSNYATMATSLLILAPATVHLSMVNRSLVRTCLNRTI